MHSGGFAGNQVSLVHSDDLCAEFNSIVQAVSVKLMQGYETRRYKKNMRLSINAC